MKYHKIYGVDKAVCTAEQKIAYNIAFRLHIGLGDKYRALPSAVAKAEAFRAAIDIAMHDYRNSYDYTPGKYDEDSIFCALAAGLAGYLEKPFIACNYESIGAAFPAHYLHEDHVATAATECYT